MTKFEKIRICDWSLVLLTVVTIVISILLEVTGSISAGLIWAHSIIAILFFADIIWHIYLHFKWKSWIYKFCKLKSPATRWLAVSGLLTLLTGIAAIIRRVITAQHSPLGAVHGKIGFIFMMIVALHTMKRISFYKSQGKNKILR